MTTQTKWYTVCGYYDDTDQSFADHIEATDQYQAMARVGAADSTESLVLIGAIEGKHELLTPGDDNGTIAYAYEMADLLVTQ